MLVAIGLLVLQAPSLFHLLLVSHTTCEHGELVELPAGSEPHVSADDHDRSRERADRGHPEKQGHDHCDALAVRHRPADVAPPLVAPSLLTIAPAILLGESAESRPLAVLALAPKSSPPRA
jgi:hypothetical protein